jgi:AraC family transcriptional regulator
MQYGWNVKYKKGGRSLCTLYPQEGSFLALVVIGQREIAEAEILLPFLSAYVQQVFAETKTGMQQKWLMIEVKNTEVLEDVKQLVALRRPKKGVTVRWV